MLDAAAASRLDTGMWSGATRRASWRSALLVPVLLGVVGLASPDRSDAAEPVGLEIEVGEPVVLALRGGRSLWWGHVAVPAGTRRLHVAVHADQPVGVFLSREAVAEAELTRHVRHRTRSPAPAARITLEGSEATAGRWQIAVKHPEADVRDIRFEVVVLAEREVGQPVLFADGQARRVARSADGGFRSRLFLPRGHDRLVLQVRDAGGEPLAASRAPAMRWRVEGPEQFRLEQSGADLVLPERIAPPGVYEVIGRGGSAAPAALQLALRAAPERVAAAPPQRDGLVELRSEQPLVFTLGGVEGTRSADAVLDVASGSHGVELLMDTERSAHVDLLVQRGTAVEPAPQRADWMALAHTPRQRLVLGGPGGLEAGRYRVRVALRNNPGATSVRLRARFLEQSPGVNAWGDRPVRNLDSGRWKQGSLEVLRSGVAWYRIQVPTGSTSLHTLLLDASAPLDLLLARPEDGRVIARALTERVDERIDYVFREATEAAREVLLGVACFGTEERAASYRIAVGVDAVPALPADYAFPPVMRTLGLNPLERAATAIVEIAGLGTGGGSGVCVSPYGRILTCRHVLETGSDDGDIQRDRLIVAYPRRLDEPPVQAFFARVVYEDRDLDLAVLELTRDIFGRRLARDLVLPHLPLPPAAARQQLGDPLQVLGYPAEGSPRSRTPVVASRGTVAGLERERGRLRWIKTDAWIGLGHSGGAVLDEDQRLVGIAAATLGPAAKLGLVVPLARLPEPWRRWIEGS